MEYIRDKCMKCRKFLTIYSSPDLERCSSCFEISDEVVLPPYHVGSETPFLYLLKYGDEVIRFPVTCESTLSFDTLEELTIGHYYKNGKWKCREPEKCIGKRLAEEL